MISTDTLLFVKSNLTVINYLSSSISFLFGISPLFMDKDRVLAHHTPFWIEISAAFLLLFNIFMFSLNSISDKPMFQNSDCIVLKNKYLKRLEFFDEYDQKTLKILKIGDNNYLLSYKSMIYEMPIKEDFKYKSAACN